jgi:hypothetical protein
MGIDDVVDGVVGGSAWGLGVAMIAGAALLVGKGGRPLAKRAIKGYLILSERARELTAEAGEQLQDLYAEAQAELEETNSRAAAERPTPPSTARRERRTRQPAEA